MKKPLNWNRVWRQFKVYVIFVIAVFAFAILGMFQSDGLFTGGGMAAQVNGKVISMKDYQDQLQMIQRQMEAQFGNLPAAQRQMFENTMRSQALSRLISSEVLYQSASEDGILATDKEVKQEILDIPVFSENGRFMKERYENYLRSVRLSPKSFEEQVRKQIVTEKMRNLFSKTIRKSKAEAQFQDLAQNTKFDVSFLAIDKKEIADAAKVDSTQVSKFVESEKAQIEEYYNSHKSDYTTKAQAKARHILVKADPNDKKSMEAAKKKIDELEKNLTLENFSEMAKSNSDDPGSKLKGGDLGYFTRGKMVKEFEDAAFTQPVGKVGPPIKTSFGYHIILVDERKDQSVQELKDVESEIAQKILAKKQLEEDIDKLKEALKKQDHKFVSSFAKRYKLSWTDTGEFNLASGYIPKIGVSDQLMDEVIRLKKENQLGDEIVKNRGKDYVVLLKKIHLAQQKDVKDNELENTQKVSSVFGAWLQAVQKDAKIVRNASLLGDGPSNN